MQCGSGYTRDSVVEIEAVRASQEGWDKLHRPCPGHETQCIHGRRGSFPPVSSSTLTSLTRLRTVFLRHRVFSPLAAAALKPQNSLACLTAAQLLTAISGYPTARPRRLHSRPLLSYATTAPRKPRPYASGQAGPWYSPASTPTASTSGGSLSAPTRIHLSTAASVFGPAVARAGLHCIATSSTPPTPW